MKRITSSFIFACFLFGLSSVPLFSSAQLDLTLKPGTIGEQVTVLQRILNSLGKTVAPAPEPGSPGKETTYYGNLTASAVQAFQCEKGIVCDGDPESTGFGIVGPKTRALLNSLYSSLSGFFSRNPSAQLAAIGTGSNLVAHYTFDEGSGTTAGDASGNNNTGTLTNGPTWTVGKVGSGAISLDGTNQTVNIPGFTGLSGQSAATISLWIKPSAMSKAIISQWNNGRLFELDTTGSSVQMYWRYGGSGGSGTTLTHGAPSGSISSGAWQHIVFVYNSPASTFYLNGSSRNTVTGNGGALNSGVSDPMRIGWNNMPSFYAGAIDDVRIYNRALTASEVAELYSLGGGTVEPPPVEPPPTVNQTPTARITTNTTSGAVPLSVSFNGSTSSDSDGSISSYAWNFGDNTSATGVTTSHTYQTAGTYTARLTVTDNLGATANATVSITAGPNPPAEPLPTTGPTLTVKKDGSGNFTTIQACADSVQAGQTCLVYAGNYPEHVLTKSGGTSNTNRVVFRAEGTVTMIGFEVKHPYVTIDGFDITGDTQGYPGYITVNSPAHYCKILNNTIRDGLRNTYGISIYETSSTSANNCVFQYNRITNMGYHLLSTEGSGHLFEYNTLENGNGWDLIRSFGHDHIFRRNVFKNSVPYNGISNHPDFVQTFSDNGGKSYNMLFEENYIYNLPASPNGATGYQLGQMNSGGGIMRPVLSPNYYDYTFRNNIFVNVASNMNAGLPGMQFIHNTFYRLAYTANGLVYGSSLVTSDASRGTIASNAFVDGGINTANTVGFYGMSGAELSEDAIVLFVTKENILSCRGSCPISEAILADLVANGYTNWNGVPSAKAKALTDISQLTLANNLLQYKTLLYDTLMKTVQLDNSTRQTFVADYNFVSPAKDTRIFIDQHGVNGGDPRFVNINDPDGPDNIPFTLDDGIKPRPDSPLCGKGQGGTDIGALSCDPTKLLSTGGGTVTPVSTYTLTVLKQGTGTGTVTGGSINCGSTCSQSAIAPATVVSLTATPNAGATVTWQGCSSQTATTCSVTINSNTTVIATFTSTVVSPATLECGQTSTKCVPSEYPTIQACANAAVAGDTCLVAPGNYSEHPETVRGGTLGSPITFKAQYKAADPSTNNSQRSTNKGFRIKHPYVVIDGFDITKYDVGLDQGHIRIEPQGDRCLIQDNVIRDGIYLSSTNYYFDGATRTITNPAGGFVAAGFKPGVSIYIASNINRQIKNHDNNKSTTSYAYETKRVIAVTDTQLTLDPSNTVLSEGPVSATIYVNTAEKNGVWGVIMISSSADGAPENCVIRGNRLSNLAGKGLHIQGNNHLIERNTFQQMNGWRMFSFYGSNNIFRYNIFKDSDRWPDFELPRPGTIFSLGSGSWDMYDTLMTSTGALDTEVSNNIFEFNFVKDIDEQFASVEQTASGLAVALPNTGLFIRNNIFIGMEMTGSFTRPGTIMANNTFYKNAYRSSQNFVIGKSDHGNPIGSAIKNNVFLESGDLSVNTASQNGWYSIIGDDNLPSPQVVADYNFVAGPAGSGYPVKTNFVMYGMESHGINGGDPKFQNLSNPLGPDGVPFTADDGLIPLGNSPLCRAGENGSYIGAYSCAGTVQPQTSTYTLSVSKQGAGSGTVAGGSINCGSTCTQSSITSGTTVTLTATPTLGSTFSGWSGACTGTNTTCTVSMNLNQTVTATFIFVSDTVPPTVSITAPVSGSTVSGSVSISANAVDNIGVAGVQFKLDNINLGTELTTAPYSGTWNTAGVSNGPHTLLAVVRDQAGNRATSTAVAVTISNEVTLPPTVPPPATTPPAGGTPGGGGGGLTPTSTTTPATTSPSTGTFTPTVPQIPAIPAPTCKPVLTQAQITAILGLLTSFGAEQSIIDNVNKNLSCPGTPTSPPAQTSNLTITKWLVLGSDNIEVKTLQIMLNKAGYTIAQTGAGSAGKESTYMGNLTEAALKRFQCAKLTVCSGTPETTGYGATGPKTRKALSEM